MRMTLLEFVRAWLHANPALALQYFKNWFRRPTRKWRLSRHRKAVVLTQRLGHVSIDRYHDIDGTKIGVDFYVHLGASLDLYHTPALEKLGYAYPDEPYLRQKEGDD